MSDDRARYLAACHAMQTGVQLEITRKGEAGAGANHKHLRVGVNVALCDHAALAALLVNKGVITREEYTEAIAETMEAEVERYKTALGLAPNITLG